MIYIDLFSGVGGFALGAYWSGMKFDKHYFSEVEPYEVELYRKRCPDAIPLGDITKIDWKALADTDRTRELQPEGCQQEERERIGDRNQTEYIITGGFPCQDLSVAGKGAGLEGERSGLWTAMFEAIRILRPRYVIIENVGAIVGWFPRGLAGFSPDRPPDIDGDRWSVDIEQYQAIEPILNDLNSIFYDAEGQDIRAEDMGAPHKRERIWIVAYPMPTRKRWDERKNKTEKNVIPNPDRKHGNNAGYGTSEVCRERSEQTEVQRCANVADAGQQCKGTESTRSCTESKHCETTRIGTIAGDGFTDSSQVVSNSPGIRRATGSNNEREHEDNISEVGEASKDKQSGNIGKCGIEQICPDRSRPGRWLPEPCMGVLVDGLPAGLDRFEGRLSNKSYKKASQIKGIGNAILPQIAELFFLWIKELLQNNTCVFQNL